MKPIDNDLMFTVIYLLSNVLHMYSIYFIISAPEGKSRFDKRGEILTYVGYFLINSSSYLFLDIFYVNILSNILPVFLLCLQYRRPFRNSLFLTALIMAVSVVIEWGTLAVMGETYTFRTSIVQMMVFLLLSYLIRQFFVKRSGDNAVSNIPQMLILSLIASGPITLAVIMGPQDIMKNKAVLIIIILIDFSVFYLYDKMLENARLNLRLAGIENMNRAYKEQLEIMSESGERIRILRHDMKNHLLVLRNDIENGNKAKALEYIGRLTEHIDSYKAYISTGNSDLDGLLNYKLGIVDKHGIEARCFVTLPKEIGIDIFDLVVVLGNLLDNAIEASETVAEPTIEVVMEKKKNYLCISVSNSIAGSVLETNAELRTQKSDKRSHGLGLMSVGNIVTKYDGSSEFYEHDGMFTADVMLKINQL